MTGQVDEGDDAGRAGPERADRPELRGFQKRALRAMAHGLTPVAQVGGGGLSGAVLEAIDAALRHHELVKVRMHQPEDKKALARGLAEGTGAVLCGLVGHTAILYRRNPERPRVRVPDRPAGGSASGA